MNLEQTIYKNKNVNVQKFRQELMNFDIVSEKVLHRYDTVLDFSDYTQILNYKDSCIKRNKSYFFKILELIDNDINHFKSLSTFDLTLIEYHISDIKDVKFNLNIMKFWVTQLNTLLKIKNCNSFKKHFAVSLVSYLSFILSIINKRLISLHIMIDYIYYFEHFQEIFDINIPTILNQVLIYEKYYGLVNLVLNFDCDYHFDKSHKIEFFINNQDFKSLLQPIDNCLLMNLNDDGILAFCLSYNYYVKNKVFISFDFITHTNNNNEIGEEELTEREISIRNKMFSDDEEFCNINKYDEDSNDSDLNEEVESTTVISKNVSSNNNIYDL
jgi:hypothetical protein